MFFFTFLPILVLCLGFQKTVYAQSYLISGQVTDSLSKYPVDGVQVYTDAKDHALTDTNGVFSIRLSPVADTLFFQRLGYETAKLSVEKV